MEMKLKGGRELGLLLQQLPVQVEKKLLRSALVKGAGVLRDEARRLAPRDSGAMARSIKVSRDTKNGTVVAKVSLRGPHSGFGHFFEFGVAPHLITPGRLKPSVRIQRAEKKGLKLVRSGALALKINDRFVRAGVTHPGIKPHPFMGPAMENKAGEAIEVIGEFISSYLSFGNITAPTIAVDVDA